MECKIREIKRVIHAQIGDSWTASNLTTPAKTAALHKLQCDSLQQFWDASDGNSRAHEEVPSTTANLFATDRIEQAAASQALAVVPIFGRREDQHSPKDSPCFNLKPSPSFSERSGFSYGKADPSPSRIPRPSPNYKRQHKRPASEDGCKKPSTTKGSRSKPGRQLQSDAMAPITPGVAKRGVASASISELTEEFGQLTCRASKASKPSPSPTSFTLSHRFIAVACLQEVQA